MNKINNLLTIKYSFREKTFYDLAYFTTDLYQLIVFCELINKNDKESLDIYFYSPKHPYILNRYSKILLKYKNNILIDKIGSSDIQISLEGLSKLSIALISIFLFGVKEAISHYKEKVTFEISCGDKKINKIIEYAEKGDLGSGEEMMKNMFKWMEKSGYSVEVKGNDVYKISKVLDKYEKRIVRTIRKH